jgi:hypothetical protein
MVTPVPVSLSSTARDEAIIRQNENPARALVEAQGGVSGTLMANVIEVYERLRFGKCDKNT